MVEWWTKQTNSTQLVWESRQQKWRKRCWKWEHKQSGTKVSEKEQNKSAWTFFDTSHWPPLRIAFEGKTTCDGQTALETLHHQSFGRHCGRTKGRIPDWAAWQTVTVFSMLKPWSFHRFAFGPVTDGRHLGCVSQTQKRRPSLSYAQQQWVLQTVFDQTTSALDRRYNPSGPQTLPLSPTSAMQIWHNPYLKAVQVSALHSFATEQPTTANRTLPYMFFHWNDAEHPHENKSFPLYVSSNVFSQHKSFKHFRLHKAWHWTQQAHWINFCSLGKVHHDWTQHKCVGIVPGCTRHTEQRKGIKSCWMLRQDKMRKLRRDKVRITTYHSCQIFNQNLCDTFTASLWNRQWII